ncbi:replicative DNA helicase [Sphingobium yanoikuyae]|uniref:replicative DNA helicase n=1 Tax=Sphingobium yanoikuyae TaxID=13690 RepID=UPI0024331570|nr:DnaB-like helicase C-terminal domain-containing protein [Sphingobium yanoikuyae]
MPRNVLGTGDDRPASGNDPATALQNPEAEIGLLSDLLADNRMIDPAADHVRPVDFSVPLHGQVFAKMVEQNALGRHVDAVTLAPFFSAHDGWRQLERVLLAADMNAGSRDRTKAYLQQVCDLGRRRRMVQGLEEVVQSARDGSETCDNLIVLADEAVAELADEDASAGQAHAGVYARDAIASFGKPIVGVKCGIIGSLDKVIGYLRPGELIVGGGRPGMGKTSVVTTYAWGAASAGHPVLMFSLEMSGDELSRRILADMCCTRTSAVLYENVVNGDVRGDDLRAVKDAARRLDALPLEIADKAGITLAMLTRRVRRHKRRLAAQNQKLELVIIDYLQLMQPSRPGMSPYESASEISKGLKTLAKEEGLAVLALAQLNRNAENRDDHRPKTSDLRDSGQIEQDADAIFFVYRHEVYVKDQKPEAETGVKYTDWLADMKAAEKKIEFIVPKRRNMPPGKGLGWFFGQHAAVRGSDFYSSPDEDYYG